MPTKSPLRASLRNRRPKGPLTKADPLLIAWSVAAALIWCLVVWMVVHA